MAIQRKPEPEEALAARPGEAQARSRPPVERRLEAVSGEARETMPLMVEPEFLLAALLSAVAFHMAVAPNFLLSAVVGAVVAGCFLALLWRRPGIDAPLALVYAASTGAIAHAAGGGDAVAAGIVAALVGTARLAEGWRRRRRQKPGSELDPYA